MQSVGELVRTRRQARGMTLAALARAAGVTKSYLSMIENQRVANPPSRQVLAALEEALGMEEGELRCVAAWQSAPLPVRAQLEHLAEQARRAQEFARWLRASTSRRAGGGKNLDKLYRTGQLRKRLQEMIGEAEEAERDDPPVMPLMPAVRSRVPLINKVAAGYPSGFTDLDYPARIADDEVPCPAMDDPDAFAAVVCGDSMLPEYREGDIVVFSPAAKVISGCDCFVRLEPDHETTFKRVFFDDEGDTIRLQPLNPQYPPVILPREQVAGLYRAVWRMSKV